MKKILGIELGSTRIKAVLIDENAAVLAKGEYDWENRLTEDGFWSYEMSEAKAGLQSAYAALVKNYGAPLETLDAIGISAMMHGYLPFDEEGVQLADFRTWRNTDGMEAEKILSVLFDRHVPARYTVSEYFAAVLRGEEHLPRVRRLYTLSSYVHFLLTGEYVVGIGDASGMFPVKGREYNAELLAKFNRKLREFGITVDFSALLPRVLTAGEAAGVLSEEGARLLDPTGYLKPGVPLCPPEGDMGTGAVCTDTVTPGTANLSLGTSGNLAVTLPHPLAKPYMAVDLMDTPDGSEVALFHAGTCTSVLNEWVGIFEEVIALAGGSIDRGALFTKLFESALAADGNFGGYVGYNFLSGEPVANVKFGCPLLFRNPTGVPNLSNFMAMQLSSAIATPGLSLEILKEENVRVSRVVGHGGYFKTPEVGQRFVSAMLDAPVSVYATAGEGGAFGIALLALFLLQKGISLPDFLEKTVNFGEAVTVTATPAEVARFSDYMAKYKQNLPLERFLSDGVFS